MDKKTLLQHCRYYDGSDKCPFKEGDVRFTAWKIERLFVDVFDHDVIDESISEYLRRGMADFHKDDAVPLSLKAFLMNRYFQYTEREDIDDFKRFYDLCYLKSQ